MALHTELTKRLGFRYPIIAAPLGRGSTSQLLAALAREGAMGFVALMHMPETEVRQTLSGYVTATGGGERFGVNLTLIIDQTRRLEAALEAGCRIVSLWQGDPAPYARRAKDAGAIVFWTVSGPADAARAADLGVDFVVAQGREAGGHLVGEAPLMTLLPAVVDAAAGVPVVAAGGLADGRGLAAALVLGACGAWMGTRFVASAESGNHPGYKQKITEAGFADSDGDHLVRRRLAGVPASGDPEFDLCALGTGGLPCTRVSAGRRRTNWHLSRRCANATLQRRDALEVHGGRLGSRAPLRWYLGRPGPRGCAGC